MKVAIETIAEIKNKRLMLILIVIEASRAYVHHICESNGRAALPRTKRRISGRSLAAATGRIRLRPASLLGDLLMRGSH